MINDGRCDPPSAEGLEESGKYRAANSVIYTDQSSRAPATCSTFGGRIPLGEEIINHLKAHPAIKDILPAGSLRRRQETMGEIDILATEPDHRTITEHFTHLPQVKEVLAAGKTKSSITVEDDLQIDLRVVSESSYEAVLQYFTGSKAHNIKLRQMAKERGLKISEYSVFKRYTRQIAGTTGAKIYENRD